MAGAYKGSLIRTVVNVSTLAGCAAVCREEHLCLYFAIHVARGCQLRKKRGVFYDTEAYDTGMGECIKTTTTKTTTKTTTTTLPPGCTRLDSVVNGVAGVYKGSLLRTVVNVSTLAGCAAVCREEHLCLYFAIHVARGCQLRKTKGGFQPSGAFTAGMGKCIKTTTAAPTTTTATAAATPGGASTTAEPNGDDTACLASITIGASPHSTRPNRRGDVVGEVPHGAAPDTRRWSPVQCARYCAAVSTCEHWIVNVRQGCILMRRHFSPAAGGRPESLLGPRPRAATSTAAATRPL